MTKIALTVLGQERNMEIREGETLLDALRRQLPGQAPTSPCGGKHTCGKCKIIVKSGSVSAPTEAELVFLTPEELKNGVRLACFATATEPFSPVTVDLINTGSEHKILSSGLMPAFDLNPVITKRRFSLIEADVDAVTKAPSGTLSALFSKTTKIEIPDRNTRLLRQLAEMQNDKQMDVVYFQDEPVSIEAAREGAKVCAVAVDIGTTTVACTLLDLETGEELGHAADINPQTMYGSDVLSRIEHTMQNEDGCEKLQALIVSCLDRLTVKLAEEAGVDTRDIYAYALAANTTMLHLLLGINPRSIALAPYYPVFTNAQTVGAHSLGLKNCSPDTVLCCLPSISSYIGADILAGIDISSLSSAQDNVLFIDIGTNGEIVLSQRGVLSACSCAAGPALEGMNISCGMRAADGAIEQIVFGTEGFTVKTIGDSEPTGICGSGVLDMVATLLRHGALDLSGRIAVPLPAAFEAHIRPNGKSPAFIVSGGKHPVEFTQSDIRQVQLAKGAILSGITALLKNAQLSESDVDRVLIAGQFGSHLSEESLLGAGILPDAFKGKVRYIGNTSLSGAELFLLDRTADGRMNSLSQTVSYMELATYPGYTRLLMDCMKFPSTQ